MLRFNYQFCAVVFWFLLTGGVGALLYRVIYESAQIWNIKHQEYKNFGLFSRTLTTYLQWPASILGGISVGIASLTWSGLSAFANNLWLNPRGFMLHIAGASLGIQLGGPAFYQGVKRKSDKYGGPRELVLDDLQRCRNLLKLSRLLWVCICLIGYIVLYLLGT